MTSAPNDFTFTLDNEHTNLLMSALSLAFSAAREPGTMESPTDYRVLADRIYVQVGGAVGADAERRLARLDTGESRSLVYPEPASWPTRLRAGA